MKMIKLAHPSQVRSVPDNDADRYLRQGWVTINEPVKANAIRQRQFRRKRSLLGYKRFGAYLPPALFELAAALKLPGEDNAGLLERLLLHASAQQGREDTNN